MQILKALAALPYNPRRGGGLQRGTEIHHVEVRNNYFEAGKAEEI